MTPFAADGSGGFSALPAAVSAAEIRRTRGPKHAVDPGRPIAVWDEEEVAAAGRLVTCRVVLLAGAECPFTCAMCDLWRHTLDGPTPLGALPEQIATALAQPADPDLGEPRWIKLYNASNFTDPHAVPPADIPRIAALLKGFERVIVETHPRLVDASLEAFAGGLTGRLEVALGLETTDPRFLPWLNKQMTTADFSAAAVRLRAAGIDARAFVLLGLPGVDERESVAGAIITARFAAAAGCRHVCLIPTRPGNGHLDELAAGGRFVPVSAAAAEAALAGAIATVPAACLVTLDRWDWDRMTGHCDVCRAPRRDRIGIMNRDRGILPPLSSPCGCPDDV